MWECCCKTLNPPKREKKALQCGKEKNRFALIVFYLRLVTGFWLCLILKSDVLILSAGWKCVFLLACRSFSRTSPADSPNSPKLWANGKSRLPHVCCFQGRYFVHVWWGVVWGINGHWDLFITEQITWFWFCGFDWLINYGAWQSSTTSLTRRCSFLCLLKLLRWRINSYCRRKCISVVRAEDAEIMKPV